MYQIVKELWSILRVGPDILIEFSPDLELSPLGNPVLTVSQAEEFARDLMLIYIGDN